MEMHKYISLCLKKPEEMVPKFEILAFSFFSEIKSQPLISVEYKKPYTECRHMAFVKSLHSFTS